MPTNLPAIAGGDVGSAKGNRCWYCLCPWGSITMPLSAEVPKSNPKLNPIPYSRTLCNRQSNL